MIPTERILKALRERNCHPRRAVSGWMAICPAHDDQNPSLSINEGDKGGALVNCFAGCPCEAIVNALGLRMSDLMPPPDGFTTPVKPSRNGATRNGPSGERRIVKTYDYCDEAGKVLFQVVRYEPKDFRQRRPKPDGGLDWSVKDVRVVPYRLPEILADLDQVVLVVEGEKDADNLTRLGFVATCNAGGAGKWTAQHAEFLRDRKVVVLPDNDDAGQRHAHRVVMSLQGVAVWARILPLPDLPPKGDVSDWIAAGNDREVLEKLLGATANWTQGSDRWPPIVPLDAVSLPEFPSQVLTPTLRQWVEAVSHATQTPPDLAGLLGLAVCSATIAGRVEVEAQGGWREPANLFVAVLLEPGNRKSAVFSEATQPLRDLEAEWIDAARSEIARAQSDRRQREARLKSLEKKAWESGIDEDRRAAGDLAAELANQMAPALPRLLVDDVTGEKLAMMLAEQDGRLASMSAEGGVFDLMAGMYGKNGLPQFDVYLKGHCGDDLRVDRVMRDPVWVKKPALTCAYAIQPTVVESLARKPVFRGRGLLGRFLYAFPESWIGSREIGTAPLTDSVRQAYGEMVRSLACLEGQHLLKLTPEAHATFDNWQKEIENELAEEGSLEALRDWGGKLAGTTLRLAAVMHCAGHGDPDGSISDRDMEAAIEIARYLIPHAELVLNMLHQHGVSRDDDASWVLRWIKRHNKREFTQRDLHQQGKRRFPRSEDTEPVLHELVERGYIRPQPTDGNRPGRRASPAYDVNPAVFARTKSEKRSPYSHNSAKEHESLSSENTGSASE